MGALAAVVRFACRGSRLRCYFLLVLLTRLQIAIGFLYQLSDSKWHYYLEPQLEYLDVGFV